MPRKKKVGRAKTSTRKKSKRGLFLFILIILGIFAAVAYLNDYSSQKGSSVQSAGKNISGCRTVTSRTYCRPNGSCGGTSQRICKGKIEASSAWAHGSDSPACRGCYTIRPR